MTPEESALLVKLQVMKAERDRYRRTLERLRDAEDSPAIVRAICTDSLNA